MVLDMLTVLGFYDYEEESNAPNQSAETSFDQRADNSNLMTRSLDNDAVFGSPEYPPPYDDFGSSRRTPSVSMSQMPTLDLKGRRDRISEYDSEDSVEV